MKYPHITTTSLTIVFLILIKNVAQIGSYAASKLATFDDNAIINSNNNLNSNETHRLTKRMDLESCLGQFDVHKNTIIRTGESQAIGGKYLQGIELETMEECQRLCCETDSCDVYIFESKKDGYCYLFECGTPENFHCKFTRHANYTSAVLTPILRPVNEVTTPHPPHLTQSAVGHGQTHVSTTNISQQEWELSNLKVKPDFKDKTNDMNSITSNGATVTNSNNKKSLMGLASMENSLTPKVNTSVQCGRFQFACHSGECIAVYNACDGIPQCEDGSDEGPECTGANNNLNSKTNQEIAVTNKVMNLPQYSNGLAQQTPQQQLQSMQQQQQTHNQLPSAIGLVNNREDPNVWETRKIVAETGNQGIPETQQQINQIVAQQQLQQQQQQQQQGDSFTSYINNRNQNNNVYNAGIGSSTLEQSGLYMPHVGQEVAGSNTGYTTQQQQQQQHILLPPPPPPPPAPLNSNWQQQAILNQQKLQQQQQQLASQSLNGQQQSALPKVPQSYMGQSEALQPPTLQQQQQLPDVTKALQHQLEQEQQQSAQKLVPSLNQQQTQQQQQQQLNEIQSVKSVVSGDEKVSENSEEYEDSVEKSTEPPKKHKHKKTKSKSKDLQKTQEIVDDTKAHLTSSSVKSIKSAVSPVHEQYEIIHQNMALEFRDHDGQSERPGGAVLSLTLGLLITAALAILIGCRMRTVGRRARRLGGKTPYSHEADFLVNGMYL